jgi:hypothetical protein
MSSSSSTGVIEGQAWLAGRIAFFGCRSKGESSGLRTKRKACDEW